MEGDGQRIDGESLVPPKKARTENSETANGELDSSMANEEEEDSGNMSESSDASSSDWQDAPSDAMAWVHTQMMAGADPRQIIRELMPEIKSIPATVGNLAIWKLIVSILCEPPRRNKLPNVNTLEQVVNLINSSKNILVLTGAGVSVSCGIPDFRSKDGVYARLAVDFPDLPDPQAMFDMQYFLKDPRPFFKFAKEIYPGQFQPSRCHKFISLLDKTNRLLRNYTQNIDTLEQVAGIKNVVQCHGSFATASCLKCKRNVDCETIREDIFNRAVPHCTVCPAEDPLGIMKPDIVFFGQSLPQHFHKQMSEDKHKADLLIVIGSSLKVRPVALIPNSLPHEIPQVLINREPLHHLGFDVELLGNGDTVIAELCRRLGGEFVTLAQDVEELKETQELPPKSPHKEKIESTENIKNNKTLEELTSENPKEIFEKASCSKLMDDKIVNNEEQPKQELTDNVEVCSNRKLKYKEGDSRANSAAEEELHNLWQSRWKESISKRLPPGHFYYNGGNRYVFPGAEVAPEEDSDLESSSDESEDEKEEGPGGLSATRRDLSTNPPNSIHRFLLKEDEEEGCCFHHHHEDETMDEEVGESSCSQIQQLKLSSSSHIVPDEFVDMVSDHKPLQLDAPHNVESILELEQSSNNVVFTPEKEVALSDIEDVLNGGDASTQGIEAMTTQVHINEECDKQAAAGDKIDEKHVPR